MYREGLILLVMELVPCDEDIRQSTIWEYRVDG